jgi:hypothetical protein
MSRSDDPFGAMSRLLSPDLAEQLLAGTSAQADLEPSAVRVATLLSAMRNPAPTAEPVERQAVASIVAAIQQAPRPLAVHRRSRTFAPRKSARIAIVAASISAVLAGGGVAAAATGSLPMALQSAVSGALSHVGISVPNPHSHGSDNSAGTGNARGGTAHGSGPGGVAIGPDATSSAMRGLCQAWLTTPTTNADGQHDNSAAFVDLQKAAAKAGVSVAEYCKNVTAPAGTKPTTTPTTVSRGHTPTSVGHGSTPTSGHGNGSTPTSVGHGTGSPPTSGHADGSTASSGHGPPTSIGSPRNVAESNRTSTTTTA